jgi:hypothetical protein
MKHLSSIKPLAMAILSLAIVSLIAWMAPPSYFTALSDNDFLRELKKKTLEYASQAPEDRLYLALDKPFYEPGETIWFSIFIRDGETLKPSQKSDIVHVELLNPKGTVEKTLNLIARKGISGADFNLPAEAAGGLYKIRAYTNWMKNEGEHTSFEREIQVQELVLPNLKMKLDFEKKAFGAGDEVIAKLELNSNENKPLAKQEIKYSVNLGGKNWLSKVGITDNEGLNYIHFKLPDALSTSDGLLNVIIDYKGNAESISQAIPIVRNKIQLSIFPEGGDLVNGTESQVAFSALNEFGKPADVSGDVVTTTGILVTIFSSFHQGMGVFSLKPQEGLRYVLRINTPRGINETYPVPEALLRGYVMHVDASKESELNISVLSTETENLSVVAQVRGKIYYSTELEAKPGINHIIFPTNAFPAGVAQISLFDAKGIARCERLAFVNARKQLLVQIETDKEKYLPREKVKMTIHVKDDRGLPMPANLSLSVVNDQLLSFAADKTGNLLSSLLLEQDIQCKVEEPAFYFNAKEAKAATALDYLMMTAGWRRFSWEKVMAGDIPAANYPGEKAILGGVVMDAATGKTVANARIKCNGAEYVSDASGHFLLSKTDLYEPTTMFFTADGFQQANRSVQSYDQNLVVYLYNVNYSNQYRNYPAAGAGLPGMAPQMAVPAGEEVIEREEFDADAKVIAQQKHLRGRAEAKHDKPEDKNLVVLKKEKQPDNNKSNALQGMKASVADDRLRVFGNDEGFNAGANPTVYYRARKFPETTYVKTNDVQTRMDFRNTVYWNPNVEIDRSGKKTVEFYLSDDITSFRASAEGLAVDGMPGRSEKTFFSQLPFELRAKLPIELASDDVVSIPLTLSNNTDNPLGGILHVEVPEGLQELSKTPEIQTIMPGKSKTIYLDYKVLSKTGEQNFTVSFKSCGLSDAVSQKLKIVSKGFPQTLSFSGQETDKEYSFSMSHVIAGSVSASFTAFPNVVSDLMKGVEGILREPYGCFEQTSMSSYPNALVLDYLKSTDSKDDKTLTLASNLLEKGYKRLITFETKDRGYEWFGSNPGHEALTAYGLMQFTDMKKVGQEVDEQMMSRTIQWLNSRKDGKGGFLRSNEAADAFGRATEDITNAYIVYALSEAGFTDLKKEFASAAEKAFKSNDPYQLALLACAGFNLKEKEKANQALAQLLSQQSKKGSWTGLSQSVTCSTGQSLEIETTSLVILAMLKSPAPDVQTINSAVHYLVGSRNGTGTFGNTQGTILALKALTSYAKFNRKTNESGTVEVYVDGRKVATKDYQAGEKGNFVVGGLEAHLLKEGNHTLRVRYTGVKTPLPYSVLLNWSTSLPESDASCAVELRSSSSVSNLQVGETLRMQTTLTNRRSTGIPSTMVIVGIPAGFTAQAWQLKEMQEKKVFDYYEIKGNNLAVYYRCLAPGVVKHINLDLKAELPGEFEAPASCAYLYYTNELKSWSQLSKVTIRKNGI